MVDHTHTIDTIYIFIFLFSFIITLIGLIAYSLFRPEYTHPKYNFTPFPTITPVEIPDANLPGTGNCQNKIQACDKILGCSMCDDCYECTPVGDNEEVIFNGQKVLPGNWCLPKGKRDLGCGTYTGRAIWAADTCSGGQTWKCVCLYPELFGGADCLTQLACKDNNIEGDQSNNLLVSTDGKIIWDPSNPNFDPQGTTPYDYNDDGVNPKFTCQCNQNSGVQGQVQFITMPNDPYRCHAEPCTPDHILKAFDQSTQQCKCIDIAPQQFAHSNVTGQCLNVGNICTWDDTAQVCKCAEDQGEKTVNCNNPDFMTRPGVQNCPAGTEYPGGSYCKLDACTTKGGLPYCENGGIPSAQQDGTCKCDCSKIEIPDQYQVNGDRCESICGKTGVDITQSWDHPNWDPDPNKDPNYIPKPDYTSLVCCSKDATLHTEKGFPVPHAPPYYNSWWKCT